MANKTKSTGYASSSKGKFKWGAFWTGLTVFVLVAAIVFTFIMVGSSGGKDWSFSRVFPKKGAGENQTQTDNVIIGESDNHGISLMSMAIPTAEYETYGISAQAENAQIITAAFTPASTTNKNVTWTSSIPQVVVTPVEGNSLQATVTVTGAFSTQGIVTCTSEENSSIKATVTVDYVKGVSKYETDTTINSISDGFIPKLNFTEGTIMPDTVTCSLTIGLGGDIGDELKARGWNEIPLTINVSYNLTENRGFYFIDDFIDPYYSITEKEEILQDFADITYNKTDIELFEIIIKNVTTSYKGVTYKSYSYSDFGDMGYHWVYVKSTSELVVHAKGLSTDKVGLIFG